MSFERERLLALLHLIDEPDEDIWTDIRKSIIDVGELALDDLKGSYENALLDQIKERIEDLIFELSLQKAVREIETWCKLGQKSLLTGTIILERVLNPFFQEENTRKKIENIRFDIWLELSQGMSPLEKIKVFNNILFHVNGFNRYLGNNPETLPPLLSHTVEHRSGGDFTSTLIYILLGIGTDLPLKGFLLGKKLFLSYSNLGEEDYIPFLSEDEPLFLIDPSSLGLVLSRQELTDAFSLSSEELKKHVIDNKKILQLQLLYLLSFYRKENDERKFEICNTLINVIKK